MATIPIGRSGRLEAQPLTNATGAHALLIRGDGQPRALLSGETVVGTAPSGEAAGEGERLIVTPLDEDEVEFRLDGDALAVWLTQGSLSAGAASAPAWATAIGFALVLVAMAFTLLGAATFVTWLLGALGLVR